MAMHHKVNKNASFSHKELPDSPKTLRECLSSKRNIKFIQPNPIDIGPAKIIPAGIKTCSKITQGLFKILQQG